VVGAAVVVVDVLVEDDEVVVPLGVVATGVAVVAGTGSSPAVAGADATVVEVGVVVVWGTAVVVVAEATVVVVAGADVVVVGGTEVVVVGGSVDGGV
jgi:hypothetical protein